MAAARAAAEAGPGDRDGEVGLAGAGAADQHDVALVGDELAACEVAHQGFVDRRAVKGEVVHVPGWPPWRNSIRSA